MWSDKAAIQKLDLEKGIVNVYQNTNLNSIWRFETNQSLLKSNINAEVFPFVFDGAQKFHISVAGNETKLLKTSTKSLLFSDDYGVPAGFLIGILLPKGYVPEVLKFKDKPFIPTGVGFARGSIQPPGYFEVFYNQAEKIAGIAFIITSPTFFGFKLIAVPREDDFPSSNKFPFYSDLFATLKFEDTHPIHVSADDLEAYKQFFSSSVDLSHIADLLNELLTISNNREEVSGPKRNQIISQLQNALLVGSSTVAFADSAIALADSYIQGDSVAKIINKILGYLSF